MHASTRPTITGWGPLILTNLHLLGYTLYTLHLFGVPTTPRGEIIVTLFIVPVMVCAGSFLRYRFGTQESQRRGNSIWSVFRVLCGIGLFGVLFSNNMAVLQQWSGQYMVLTLLLAGLANVLSHPDARLEEFSAAD